ncbi:tRNA-guanine transglycosylase [Halorussus halobius]|jgi:7-cyano-7-deazaguanine tRNA-ribosyltransferase|uniref:tRNA-guanine transglycosylase n=1 Tax=Halorussus halobius TaxID=1710537 RepID=UPI00143D2BD0|nr:tRNA-guanine transglycosylase [Halorussus halobius]
MSAFSTLTKARYGRRGEIETPVGQIQTPALLPVANLIGGTTPESGGIWRYTRRHLFQSDTVQGLMFQTMTFLDYNLTSDNLAEWRKKPLKQHFEESDAEPGFTQPLFVDSGGFKLMNSTTFGQPPEEGGSENDWGIYTNPESILKLQLDYGADIVATLDFPIPQNLNKEEATERMERSIDNAVECLQLLNDDEKLEEWGVEKTPSVYVAIHGHSYEDVNWYVSKFLDRAEELDEAFEGFALGSLVPLSNSPDVLVDIVQGARDAIPEERYDDIALHVFGISGRLCPLLSLLGVDTFDSSNYLKAARNKSFIHPETWQRTKLSDWDEEDCDCQACQDIYFDDMRHALLESDVSYKRIEGEHGKHYKSEYYAQIAHHNFELYSRQMQEVRAAIEDDELLELVAEFAQGKNIVEKGLKRAQLHNPELREQLADNGYEELVAGPDAETFQTKLSGFVEGVEDTTREKRTISLKHGPNDFNILQQNGHQPPSKADVLLILPCSQEKPYSDSRTQQAVLSPLEEHRDRFHKISVSGLYGPVPEEFEEADPVMSYEYVLTTADDDQVELVANRLAQYLDRFGEQFDHILAYTTSKAYRRAINEAFTRYGRGEIYPSDPRALQLTEHFRGENINELVGYFDSIDG